MNPTGQPSPTRTPIELTLVSIVGIVCIGTAVTVGVTSGSLVAEPAFVGAGVLGVAIVIALLLASTEAERATGTLHGSLAIGLTAALLGAGFLFGATNAIVAVGVTLTGVLTVRKLGRSWGAGVLAFGIAGAAGLDVLAFLDMASYTPAYVEPAPVDLVQTGLGVGAMVMGALLALGFVSPVETVPETPLPRERSRSRTGSLTPADMARMSLPGGYTAEEILSARHSMASDPSMPPTPDIEATLELQKLESLGVLAGGVAHDFNNLLMSILGNASLALMEGGDGDETPLREIETAAKRARDLVGQLLAYAGKGTITAAPLDLNHLVQEMGDLLSTAGSARTSIHYTFCEEVPLMVADATQVRQIVMNLITNAADAMTGMTDAQVEVETRIEHLDRRQLDDTLLGVWCESGPFVRLRVRDQGIGMDQETLSRIFDPFYTTKKTGRGLGLAAVLGIVRRYGGTMAVESVVGEGTTFRIYFPFAEAMDEDEDLPTEQTSTAMGWATDSIGSVLVVDDDPVVLKVTLRMLERLDLPSFEAHDGEAGVELYREKGDDIMVVLLDMTMPGMDGVETLAAIREIDPEARVILTSGYSEADVPKTGSVFLQKPYTMKQLTQALDQAFDQPA